jgi:hypothetical protein
MAPVAGARAPAEVTSAEPALPAYLVADGDDHAHALRPTLRVPTGWDTALRPERRAGAGHWYHSLAMTGPLAAYIAPGPVRGRTPSPPVDQASLPNLLA